MKEQALNNCQKTLKKLTQFLERAEAAPDEMAQAAVIQAFEFTFEVFWKTFQKIGQAEGVNIGSPKNAFSFAYQANLIENETAWLDLLNDRNMTTHTYHEVVAQQIYERVKNVYVHEFRKAYEKLITHQ